MVCGKANFTNLSRYGEYSERTYRRHYRQEVDFIAFHAATIEAAIGAEREQIAAMDCSFIGKSGTKTWGLDQFYNGSAGKAEKGLEISVLAVVDVAAHQGYTLSVQQTKARSIEGIEPTPAPVKVKGKRSRKPTEPEVSERVQGYIAQLKESRASLPAAVKYISADSFYAKKSVVDAVREFDLHLVSKLRIDANLRYLYSGPRNPRGAPRRYDGKVDFNDLSRLTWVTQLATTQQMHTQVVWHLSLKRNIRIVYLLDLSKPDKPRAALLLFSTDTELDPQLLYS